jgi:hypothetical protein
MLDATGAPKDPAQVKSGFSTLFKNKAKMAQFSPDEKQAIAIVANGGGISKALSVLSPRNPFGAVIATVAALPTHGLGAAATIGVGELARAADHNATVAGANAASALVRNGGTIPISQQAGQTASRFLQPAATIASRQGARTLADLARGQSHPLEITVP